MSSTTDTIASSQTRPRIAFDGQFDRQIGREWLLTNGRGGFSSGTAIGVPTRRYHGLLVAAARPPLERWLLLHSVLERIGIDGEHTELAAFDFGGSLHPRGDLHQVDFRCHNHPEHPFAEFTYTAGLLRLTRQIHLAHDRDQVILRYRLTGPEGSRLSIDLAPFVAMRDFHSVTRAFDPGYATTTRDGWLGLDAFATGPRLWLSASRGGRGADVPFDAQPHWWYGFHYREEAARGLDCREDLYVPGWYRAEGNGTIELELVAAADFRAPADAAPPATVASPPKPEPIDRLTIAERLTRAADAFVVRRHRSSGADLTTILAGYPWFGDWGRDTFIALPGLLIETGRLPEARQVLEVFASAMGDGLIPNRFSDYGDGRDYNSVDASLWFIHAAASYREAGGDETAWREALAPACLRIIEAFERGTRFNIHMDTDGLMVCGDHTTQLTWMDAKCGDIVFTPRHGKPVEINALWYHALCLMARHTLPVDPAVARHCEELALKVRKAFEPAFWCHANNCLYDVIRDDWHDLSIRPNQIFAVSLSHSPLSEGRQRAVLEVVGRELLTPYGLRSLTPHHPLYRGRYQGGPFDRDSVYHQGTVWGWLIGPYVEGYLRVHGFDERSKAKMRERLLPLIDHLDEAGIDSVSEIFDGDPPHTPRGCIAQAWSVSELLRAWRMTEPK